MAGTMNAKRLASLLVLPLAVGCAADPFEGETVKSEDGKADASSVALFVDFEFSGSLLASSSYGGKRLVEDQLLYTMGQLNGDRSVARLDKAEIWNLQNTQVDGKTQITYQARIPVAWGDKENVPTTYSLKLPADQTPSGLEAFATKYGHDCVDWGAHDVDSGSMWYYFRPKASRCSLAAEDIVVAEATVTVSDRNTTGKFPEYDKVWEDDALNVLAVFGKYEDGATTASDAGISAYNKFAQLIKGDLRNSELTTIPAEVPSAPGVAVPDLEFNAVLPDGKTVRVNALLVDNIRTADAAFRARYEALSTRADLILYNGHAGLGSNVRALAQRGKWTPGQYVIVFVNGCDTYAYIDNALFNAHAAINPDDPSGTKHTDIVVNAMPSFFSSMAGATMAMVRGLMKYDDPQTYEQIFRSIDRSQVVLVTGEDDNVYVPGAGGGEEPPPAWAGLTGNGSLSRAQEQRFETPVLAAGKYVFEMSGSGDADLYVRIGSAPTQSSFDCRPYKTGSNETCSVELTAPTSLHIMVRGFSSSSSFELTGRKE